MYFDILLDILLFENLFDNSIPEEKVQIWSHDSLFQKDNLWPFLFQRDCLRKSSVINSNVIFYGPFNTKDSPVNKKFLPCFFWLCDQLSPCVLRLFINGWPRPKAKLSSKATDSWFIWKYETMSNVFKIAPLNKGDFIRTGL